MSPEGEKEAEQEGFDSKLSRLDDIVQELESGDVPLEKAIALFEEGLQLSSHCTKLLEQAQIRVQKLLERVDGGADTQTLEKPKG